VFFIIIKKNPTLRQLKWGLFQPCRTQTPFSYIWEPIEEARLLNGLE